MVKGCRILISACVISAARMFGKTWIFLQPLIMCIVLEWIKGNSLELSKPKPDAVLPSFFIQSPSTASIGLKAMPKRWGLLEGRLHWWVSGLLWGIWLHLVLTLFLCFTGRRSGSTNADTENIRRSTQEWKPAKYYRDEDSSWDEETTRRMRSLYLRVDPVATSTSVQVVLPFNPKFPVMRHSSSRSSYWVVHLFKMIRQRYGCC